MKTAYVCVCSEAYLSRYKVLHDSLQKYCSKDAHLLYYTGSNDSIRRTGYVHDYINASTWLYDNKFHNQLYKHCALRPKAVLDAFNNGFDRVVLLGADTEFFDYPVLIQEALNRADCFVTMYAHEPFQDDIQFANNIQVLENGQINCDLIAFKKNDKTIKFLEWVYQQASTKPTINNKEYVDQVYFSMCFSFLDKVEVSRHLGYNVGSYNGVPRGLCLQDGKWRMKDGSSLVLYHYDGFLKGQEESISKHQNRYKATGDYLNFLQSYGNKL